MRHGHLPILCSLTLASAAIGQAPPDYDFHWATIGAEGNAPYTGPDSYGRVTGRGSVDYTYRMSTLEVTSAQWLEFTNTYSVLGGSYTHLLEPFEWGAEPDPNYSGPGQRFRLRTVADAGQLPVFGISWRQAAMFCNWLTNAKNPSTISLAAGAYDTSTFTLNPDGTFNDQPTRSPGALFWIPSLDEWLKASHFDPNRAGPGAGGWWLFPNGTDQPLTPGLPGQGQTSAGLPLTQSVLEIPLGAYPDVQSPWGLLDVSGGAEEWNEEIFGEPGFPRQRGLCGSIPGLGGEAWRSDLIDNVDSNFPSGHGAFGLGGLRIASAVPGPISTCPLLMLLLARRRRQG